MLINLLIYLVHFISYSVQLRFYVILVLPVILHLFPVIFHVEQLFSASVMIEGIEVSVFACLCAGLFIYACAHESRCLHIV